MHDAILAILAEEVKTAIDADVLLCLRGTDLTDQGYRPWTVTDWNGLAKWIEDEGLDSSTDRVDEFFFEIFDELHQAEFILRFTPTRVANERFMGRA